MWKSVQYLATTKIEVVPENTQIFMVDGRVPGWQPKPYDYCWNHHRPKGAMTQVDEMPFPSDDTPLLDTYAIESLYLAGTQGISGRERVPQTIVTTQVDADACCSAAWLQLSGSVLNSVKNAVSNSDRLRAIAYDCDHLYVPDELSHLSSFAAQAVATLKQSSNSLAKSMGLPDDQKIWSDEQRIQYGSAVFKYGTEWFINASLDKQLWPGESGEATEYWQQVEMDKQMLYESGRISVLNKVAICDMRGLNYRPDVRSFVKAIREFILPKNDLRPETLLIRDHGINGHRYTLSSLPNHPKYLELDYTHKVIKKLSEAERKKTTKDNYDCEWGGRQQVAGSAWNSPSLLKPEEVVDIVIANSNI
ncbi:hypothetical protein ACN4EK_13365 [Pantanalinema rosaneae CENA516]|uniref:hypothetical protein n=1 Tax=Pantanalinema rosaneae TaxID=1620701 RepID=UPI003D6FC8EA